MNAVRTAKFVARKQWVVAGADDMFIRVYNHNTMEKVKSFEAHTDYIRCRVLLCCQCCSPQTHLQLFDLKPLSLTYLRIPGSTCIKRHPSRQVPPHGSVGPVVWCMRSTANSGDAKAGAVTYRSSG